MPTLPSLPCLYGLSMFGFNLSSRTKRSGLEAEQGSEKKMTRAENEHLINLIQFNLISL